MGCCASVNNVKEVEPAHTHAVASPTVDLRWKQLKTDAATIWFHEMASLQPLRLSLTSDHAQHHDDLPLIVLPPAFVAKVSPFVCMGPGRPHPLAAALTPAPIPSEAVTDSTLGGRVLKSQLSVLVANGKRSLESGSMKQHSARACNATLRPAAAGPVAAVVVLDKTVGSPTVVAVSLMQKPADDSEQIAADLGSPTATQDRDARALTAFLARVTSARQPRSAVSVTRVFRDGGAKVCCTLLRGFESFEQPTNAEDDDIADAPMMRRGVPSVTPQKSPNADLESKSHGPVKGPKPSEPKRDQNPLQPQTSFPERSAPSEEATPQFSPREEDVPAAPKSSERLDLQTGLCTWFITPSANRRSIQVTNADPKPSTRRKSSASRPPEAPIAPLGLNTRLAQYWCTRSAIFPVVPALTARTRFQTVAAPPNLTEWSLRSLSDLIL